MELTITQPIPDTVVIALAGRLDATTVAGFDDESRVWSARQRILLDFSNLAYLSSAGLRSLLVLERRQRAGGGSFAVFGVPEAIRQVLTVAGFDRMIPLHETVEEALRATAHDGT